MDDIMDLGQQEADAPRKRAKQPYKEATIKASSRMTALASESSSLFDDDTFEVEKTPLSELYPPHSEVLRRKGTNGLRAISSFSGCGGSGTGFAWSGWDELAAIEFVDAARDSLHANYPSYVIGPEEVREVAVGVAAEMGVELHTDKEKTFQGKRIPATVDWASTFLAITPEMADDLSYRVCARAFEHYSDRSDMLIWGDDIRVLHPQAFMDQLGLAKGELDCWEGSPPCKSFSTSGIREDGWGRKLHYSDERHQRTDDLFNEYVRMIDGLRPKSFIAENVHGMTMGEAETQIMEPLIKEFSALGYRVEAKMVNSAEYGVPQARPRLLFQGIRKDQYIKGTDEPTRPKWPKKSSVTYTCQDALDAAAPLNTDDYLKAVDLGRYETGRIWHHLEWGQSPENKAYQLVRCHPQRPVPTITATSSGNQPAAGPMHPHECRKFTIPEYRYLFSFPNDFQFTGTIEQQGERMGRSVPPFLMKQIADSLGEQLLASETRELG